PRDSRDPDAPASAIHVPAALAVLVAVASLAVSGAARQGDALAPDNPAPGGTQALARVLQAEGVEVTLATTLEEARAAVGDGDDATLVLGATSDRLDDERLAEVGRLSTRTVLLAPDFRTLQAIAPDVAAGGAAESADRALDA
ncbi:DUF4350 domain-containing protein, partial [Clavibacter michiganensis subsp. insidiosus]|uniref:DUF4350 domain-containing protein n=1 Tax=Clavibacter michiganensis TaxID=28447 RepID=UPI000EC256A9